MVVSAATVGVSEGAAEVAGAADVVGLADADVVSVELVLGVVESAASAAGVGGVSTVSIM